MYSFFLACVLISPIPFGANRPWAWCLFAVLFGLMGLIFCVQVLLGKRQLHLHFRGVLSAFILWCIPVGWAILQASDLAVPNWTHPFWKLADEQLPNGVQAHISIDPQETWTALMRLVSYAIVFALSLQFNRDSDKAVITFKALAYAGFAYALYGVINDLGKFDTILWFDKWVGQGLVTSTFVNRNSYATYAGLTLLASMPMLFEIFHTSLKYGLASNYGRQYFYSNVFLRGWFPLLLAITIISALIMSESRGGFLSTTLGFVCLLIILLISNKINKKSGLLTLVVLIAALSWVVLEKSFDILIDRFDALDIESEGRALVYDIVSKASFENRWLGLGYGTFDNSFRLYRDETINGFYDKAHNTYLENIFELGWVQASALFLSIIWLSVICLRGVWVRRRNWLYPALGFGASVLVGAHAFVDFSLQIPAVAYTYALMLGVGVAQSFPTRKEI
jgi:O-antigen ligase